MSAGGAGALHLKQLQPRPTRGTISVVTRLQSYRAFIAAMNPSSDPGAAIEQGYYVDPPDGGIWSALTRKLELEPASTHLVLGGIGSGKTSELLRTRDVLQQSLRETGDFAEYCDVSRYHDLSARPRVGVLVALAGQVLTAAAKRSRPSPPAKGSPAEVAVKSLREFADGSFVWIDTYDDGSPPDGEPPGFWVSRAGVLAQPASITRPHIERRIPELQALLEHFPGPEHEAVMLFDSLDRLPQTEAFKRLAEHDVRALKHAGMGVVIVGPVRFMVGNDRSLADLFDHVHFQSATDPESEAGMTFLCEVLRRRTSSTNLLRDGCLPLLARSSGGVLRDLISLAKRSAEEAYTAGHSEITEADVLRATDAMGRSLAVGLDDDQLKVLHALDKNGVFVVRGERELSLLETRRVLLYPGNRWSIHPALQPLLRGVPEMTG